MCAHHFIDHGKFTVEHIEMAMLDIQNRQTFLDGGSLERGASQRLVIIVFALVAHRKHSHCFGVFHFKQRDITATPKTDHQFPQERVFGGGLATTEWKRLQNLNRLTDHRPRAFCCGQILLRQIPNDRCKSSAASGAKRT